MAAGLAPLLLLVEYGMNWEQLATEECELREMVDNDCQGFCVVTNRMVELSSMQDDDHRADESLFQKSIMNHLMLVAEHPSPSEKSLKDTDSYYIHNDIPSPFIDILAPPPKG